MSDADRTAIKGHRIVTLTMNPALDIATSTATVQRTEGCCLAARYDPGGGGVNVAHVADVGRLATAILPPASAGAMVCDLSVGSGATIPADQDQWGDLKASSTNSAPESQYRFVTSWPELSPAEQGRMPRIFDGQVGSHRRRQVAVPAGVPPDFIASRCPNVCAEIGETFMLTPGGGPANRVGVFPPSRVFANYASASIRTRYRGGATCRRRTRPGHTRGGCRASSCRWALGCPCLQPAAVHNALLASHRAVSAPGCHGRRRSSSRPHWGWPH